ncbi:MAG TPA: DUF3179 domain-containing protein [Candidatus Scalindua sp.]|nr:DUF3179 domain-containing protein [Candidatus Scalindua sp.]
MYQVYGLGSDIIKKKREKNEEINKIRAFWFAWYAFHPDTELYMPG